MTIKNDNKMNKSEEITSDIPAVEITGLNKWFDDFHVLKDISLSVSEKEIIVICGPSGSGKSTFIRCINHLETYQEGNISIFGQALENNKTAPGIIRDNIGMLFQSFNLFPHLTILKNCTLGPIWLRKISETKAIEQSLDLANRYPGQISGGQQQRVTIACSLAMSHNS